MRLLSVVDSFSRSANCGPHAEYAYYSKLELVTSMGIQKKVSNIGAAC